MVKTILKWIGLTLLSAVFVIIIMGSLFVNLSPQFGGSVTEEQEEQYGKTGHYEEGKFINKEVIKTDLSFENIIRMTKAMMKPNPNVVPKKNIDVDAFDLSLLNSQDELKVTWLGHSSFLVEMDGYTLMIDPIFSKVAAPHPWLGRNRFNSEMPFDIDSIAKVDAIIISHDHYDHLDYETITTLKDRVTHFYVPLGVGNHLRRWDVPALKIHELDWWDEVHFNSIKLAFTPSRHMSGRGLGDQSATLWGSWVFLGKKDKLYFSGDGGYGEHFKEIGEKYGPFDLGLMECGQYNEAWEGVHMMPEESVLAGQDVGAKLIMPIHWGAFSLAPHSWTDPIERIMKAAEEKQVPISTPRIGETFVLGRIIPQDRWWVKY